jgi:hypothetical protein
MSADVDELVGQRPGVVDGECDGRGSVCPSRTPGHKRASAFGAGSNRRPARRALSDSGVAADVPRPITACPFTPRCHMAVDIFRGRFHRSCSSLRTTCRSAISPWTCTSRRPDSFSARLHRGVECPFRPRGRGVLGPDCLRARSAGRQGSGGRVARHRRRGNAGARRRVGL